MVVRKRSGKRDSGGDEDLFELRQRARSRPADGEDVQAQCQKAFDSAEAGGTRTDGLFPQEADGGLDGVQRQHRDGGHGRGIVEPGRACPPPLMTYIETPL